MKLNRVLSALLVCGVVSVGVPAKGIDKQVYFPSDVVVNGSTVKKGNYRLSFDSDSGKLSIMNGKKVIAEAPARIEKRDSKAPNTQFGSKREGGSSVLTSITFRGDEYTILVGNGVASSSR